MRIRLSLVAVALACATVACRNPFANILDVFSSHSLRQHLEVGLQVGPLLSDSSEVVWYGYVLSTDGSEAYYLTHDPGLGSFRLRAASLTTGERRTILTGPRRADHLVPSADGSYLYFAWGDSANLAGDPAGVSRLYRVSVTGGDAELVLDSVLAAWPAPDGRRLLYAPWCPSSCDPQVWLYDPAGPTRRYLGRGDSVVLSPDGREALLLQSGGTYVIASLADSASRPLAVDLPGGVIRTFRWAADGLSVLYTRSDSATDAFLLRNLATGAERRLYTAGWDGTLSSVTLSPDARRMAFQVSACHNTSFDDPCYPYSGLFTVNLTLVGSDQGAGSLTASGDGGFGWPVFTPDARHVVYTYNGRLHVSDVP